MIKLCIYGTVVWVPTPSFAVNSNVFFPYFSPSYMWNFFMHSSPLKFCPPFSHYLYIGLFSFQLIHMLYTLYNHTLWEWIKSLFFSQWGDASPLCFSCSSCLSSSYFCLLLPWLMNKLVIGSRPFPGSHQSLSRSFLAMLRWTKSTAGLSSTGSRRLLATRQRSLWFFGSMEVSLSSYIFQWHLIISDQLIKC